ncbi:hypothetical protein BC828DRAFT_398262 [Blastocladiella britannica]|nr:hypothetical protein BC828DRAFT_398262 [Blastocladiella britannica]
MTFIAKEAPPLPIPGLSWTAFIWRGRHRYGGHILKVFTAFLAQNTNTSNSAAIDRLKKLVDAMVNETPLHVLLNTSTHNTEFHATAALLNIARSKIDVAITAEVEIIACLPDPKLSLALGIPRHDMSNDGGIPTSDWPKLHPDLHARLQAYFDYQKRRARESDGLLYDDDDEDCGIIPAPPAEAFYFARITPDEGGIARCTDWGAVSSTGTHIKDPGYPNDQYLQGFRRGWYDDVYWRVVGDYPSHFLAGAVAGNDYKYQIPNRLFGINRRCAMITVPGEGIVFCRGVSGGEDNPAMACVLFNDNGSIREERALERRVRHWNDLL